MRSRGWINGFSKNEGMVAVLTVIHLLIDLTQLPRLLNALIEEYITQYALINHLSIPLLQLGQAGIYDDFLLRWHVR